MKQAGARRTRRLTRCLWLIVLCVFTLVIVSSVGCARPDIIAQLRDAFQISAEEATDHQLKQFLKNENNRISVQAMLKQIKYGRELQRFLARESNDLPNVEREALKYLANKSVIGILKGTGIPFISEMIGGLSTISLGIKVYLKLADVLSRFDKREIISMYIDQRETETGKGPEQVFQDLYSAFEPIIDKIIGLSKGSKYLREGVTEQDKQKFATYLEFAYQSWKSENDVGRRESVKKYILEELPAQPESSFKPTIFFKYPVRSHPIGKPKDNELYWDYCDNKFGDYLGTYGGLKYDGFHPGEDWNLKGGETGNIDLGEKVYAIGPGKVVKKSGLGSLGMLVAIEHTGSFVIPGKTIRSSGQRAEYETEIVSKIYSVYMHINNLEVKEGDTVDENTVLGQIMNPGGGPHLHFEIRHPDSEPRTDWSLVGEKDNWQEFPSGSYNGYYIDLQEMVEAGLRDPSDFIKANSKPGDELLACGEEKAITATFLILDVSSSMGDSWQGGVKIASARTAATQMLELIGRENEAYGLNHRIGIVSFADTAHLEMNLSPEVAQAQEVVSGLDAYGNTNIGAALELASTQLQELNAQKKIMVLLSDGQTNRGLSREEILAGPVAQVQAQAIVIYTIGFGDPGDLDEEFLKNIAVASGGTYSYAAGGNELQNVYLRIRHEATGKVLADLSGTIKQGETKELADIVIERGVVQAHFTLNWAGSALELTLKDPRGKVVQEDYPRAKIFREKPLYLIVEDPQPGTWSASIYGREVPEESLAYNFIASARQKEGLPLSSLIILVGIVIATMGVAIICKGIFRGCCPECSMKLEPGTRFCPWCGRKVG